MVFSVYHDNMFPFFREFNLLSIDGERQVLVQKECRNASVIKAGEVDQGERVTLPVKFSS